MGAYFKRLWFENRHIRPRSIKVVISQEHFFEEDDLDSMMI